MEQAADMLGAIRDERGITIIWVEHIMGVLMRVVDRCIVLDHGEVIAAGQARRGRARPEGDRGLPRHRRRRGAAADRARRRLMSVTADSSATTSARGYGSFQALFGVSLEVSAGESVAVIGPNGAGKTTLLRAISKLIDRPAGELAMEGRALRTTCRRTR